MTWRWMFRWTMYLWPFTDYGWQACTSNICHSMIHWWGICYCFLRIYCVLGWIKGTFHLPAIHSSWLGGECSDELWISGHSQTMVDGHVLQTYVILRFTHDGIVAVFFAASSVLEVSRIILLEKCKKEHKHNAGNIKCVHKEYNVKTPITIQ